MPRNETDYDFPDGWGLMTPEQKHIWFTRERVFRQARQQDTAFGRAYQRAQDEEERLDTEQFRVGDEDLK